MEHIEMSESEAEIIKGEDTHNREHLKPLSITLDDLAHILRQLPPSLVQLRIDEVVAVHIMRELRTLYKQQQTPFTPLQEKAFLHQALPDEHWRDINANGVKLERSVLSEYRFRKENYTCQGCKKVFITTFDLDEHKPNCKPVYPTYKHGRTVFDPNKLA